MYKRIFKPILDKTLSLTGLILLLPLMIIIAILLATSLKANPIFIQQRTGLKGRTFSLLKFRTMTNKYNPDGSLLPDMERITWLGGLIRKLSLDEIPQLLNVLWGDMSLVGPRPLLTQYLSLYNEEQVVRHLVLPGITGWAQVNGRNGISWQQKFDYDTWYVNNVSFRTDFRILALTVLKVISGEGVNENKRSTMDFFEG